MWLPASTRGGAGYTKSHAFGVTNGTLSSDFSQGFRVVVPAATGTERVWAAGVEAFLKMVRMEVNEKYLSLVPTLYKVPTTPTFRTTRSSRKRDARATRRPSVNGGSSMGGGVAKQKRAATAQSGDARGRRPVGKARDRADNPRPDTNAYFDDLKVFRAIEGPTEHSPFVFGVETMLWATAAERVGKWYRGVPGAATSCSGGTRWRRTREGGATHPSWVAF